MMFQDYPNLKYLGKLKTRRSTEIATSRLGVGFETLDRDMWDPNQAWPVLDALGVKWARVQTGWAKTEKEPGVYDFAWLDEIVDKLLERGVQPWLSLSYGNPLYTGAKNYAPEGYPPDLRDFANGRGSPPTGSAAERNAWQSYVRALVKHYRDRVTHYEIWNEPDLTGFWPCAHAPEYAEFVRLTVEPLREEQPAARVIGGAMAWGMTPWAVQFLEDCFRHGMHEHIDIVTYHGYKSIPERHTAQEIAAFRRVIERYKPSLEYWQGEGGMASKVPEAARGSSALSTMKVSESIQARMMLRRTLLELHNGCSMHSYFHMADFGHYVSNKNTFHYGLLRLEDGSPKPSYYALQTLCTVFGDTLRPANGRTACHMSVLADGPDQRASKAFTWHANFVCGDVPVHAWWLPESVEEDPVWQPAEITYWIEHGLRLDDPVLIAPVEQDVYAVPFDWDKRTAGETFIKPDPRNQGLRHFKPVPVSNEPLMLTDRSLIAIAEA